jgi:hypothetical protein
MISSVPMDSQKALRFGICGKNCMRQNELDYALALMKAGLQEKTKTDQRNQAKLLRNREVNGGPP